MATDFKKWISFGTGLGIEVGSAELQVTIARIRPNGVAVLGSATVTEFRTRPAAEWGQDLNTFLRRLGCAHIAATVLLPRQDVIVRQLALPGVKDQDLAAAVQLQVDGLHPFAEDEAVYSFARLNKGPTILVGITRRDVLDRYIPMFAEAGIKVASFTFSAAALHASLRILHCAPEQFVALHPTGGEIEVYGESPARPIYSAVFQESDEMALTRATAELRLPPETQPVALSELLRKPDVFPPNHDPAGPAFGAHALPYATALTGACPWLDSTVNLLPLDQRRTSSRLRWIPTIALTAILLVTVGALAGYSRFENSRYLDRLQAEIRRVEPTARRVDVLDKRIADARNRAQFLDNFRKHSKGDMDALSELTKLVAPPGWLSSLEIRRNQIQISGEVEQAAPLLQMLDRSPLFENSEFTMAPSRVNNVDVFSLKAGREGQK